MEYTGILYLAMHAMIKDDAKYLQEWLEHYRLLGVQHFYIYDNNSIEPVICEDTDVTVIKWELTSPDKQHKSIYDCCQQYGQWRWIGFLDLDEFICLNRHNTLTELLSDYENYDGLAFNWMMYGTSGLKTRPASVKSFNRHAARDHISNQHVKSFINPTCLNKVPDNPHYLDVNTVGEDFQPLSSPFREFSDKVAFIKHYFTRSEEDYIHKSRRGHANDVNNVNNWYAFERLQGDLELFNYTEERFGNKINYDGWWSDNSGHNHSAQLAKNLTSFLETYKDKFICDFGCGDGFYLGAMAAAGFNFLKGVDGVHPTTPLFSKIDSANLASKIKLHKKGVIISFEVGEHIPPEKEQIFIDNIVNNAEKLAIISWAVIGQDGEGHVNCRSNDYIIEEFSKRGFRFDKEATDKLKDGIEDNCGYFRNTLMVFFKESKATMRIVQIGANKGSDGLTKYLSENKVKLDFGLFVDANPWHIEALKECYPDYTVENIAIKTPDQQQEELDFYYYEKDLPNFEIASLSPEHVLKHFPGVELKSFKVKSTTLENLLDKYDIKELDWLFLDIEGIDAEIALSFNWDKYNIARVDIEHLHLGEKREAVFNLFRSKGYSETKSIDLHGYDTGFVKIQPVALQ